MRFLASVLLLISVTANAAEVIVLQPKSDPMGDWMRSQNRKSEMREAARLERERAEREATAAREADRARSAVATASTPSPLVAFATDLNFTESLGNGRLWRASDPVTRYIYLQGVSAGIGMMSPDMRRAYACRCTYQEAMEWLTKFYDEPSFAAIPIPLAYRFFAQSSRGEAPEAIASQARETLKALSATGQ